MPSLVGKRAGYLAWLCALAGALFAPSGCHSSEENLWESCCRVVIVKDKPPTPDARWTIITWQRRTMFGGRGEAVEMMADGPPYETEKERQIKMGVAEFLLGSPAKRVTDYFISLGMTCLPTTAVSRYAKTRCEIELPIWIECHNLAISSKWGSFVPKELRQPMLAHLRMSIDVSAEAVLDVSTRIDPVPGGHLCHL